MPPATAALMLGALAGAYTTAVTFQLARLRVSDDDDELPRNGREWARLLFVTSLFLVNPSFFAAAGYVSARAAPGMVPALVGAAAGAVDLLVGSLAVAVSDLPPQPSTSRGREALIILMWLTVAAVAASFGAWLGR